MVATASTGYLPAADSPESIMAEVPSYTALATSEISALVGRGFWIIDSSISVAVMTRLPSRRHLLIRRFWMAGSSTKGISTPRSPLATIMPSQASQISSILSTPDRFSILAMISIWLPPLSSRNFRISSTFCLLETKEAATKSTSFWMPKSRSALSASLRKGPVITLLGKDMLLRLESSPPTMHLQMASLPWSFSTSKTTRPLLTRTRSPTDRSFTRPL